MNHNLEKAYWGNDPARGAALGRSNYGKPDGKVYLRKVRLDSGGYDEGGAYWGIGTPLFRAYSDGEFEEYTRAQDRDSAKEYFRDKYKGIQFFR